MWGETDCASLVRDTIDILFGPEVMRFLPEWKTLDEARMVWEMYPPVPTLRRLGAQSVGLGFRRSGDIIVHGEPDEPIGQQALSVCIDGRLGITSGRHGGVVLLDLAAVDPDCQVLTLWEANLLPELVHG